MQAKFIFEKFEENSDPITDMGIGLKNNPKSLLPYFSERLKEYGIICEWRKDEMMGQGFYEAQLEFELKTRAYRDMYEDEIDDIDCIFGYATDAAAKEEGYKGGFEMSYDDRLLLKATHDVDKAIKAIIKFAYGSKSQVTTQLKNCQKEINKLQTKAGYYQKVLKVL